MGGAYNGGNGKEKGAEPRREKAHFGGEEVKKSQKKEPRSRKI